MNELSRIIFCVLNLAPWIRTLQSDTSGWVSISNLLSELCHAGCDVTEEDIVSIDCSLFEITDNRIRVGNSSRSVEQLIAVPLDVLFLATTVEKIGQILERGVGEPSTYLPLFTSKSAANILAERMGKPSVLAVDARKAWCDGIKFYQGTSQVWFVHSLGPQYLRMTWL